MDWWSEFFANAWPRMQAEGDTVTEHSSSMRIYAYRELKDLILSSGFSRVEARDAKTGEPFRMGAGRACVLAVRS